MRTLGLIGGLSWHSTELYYRAINQLVHERLGGSHSARLLLYSVDMQDFKTLQDAGDWPGMERVLKGIAQQLEQAGAEGLALCSNTPHMVADALAAGISIPLLHIADATTDAVQAKGLSCVCLLGTRATMENDFFRKRLEQQGIGVMVPDEDDRMFIDRSIFEEFTQGLFTEGTRERYMEIIRTASGSGAQGIIYGCTEIDLLLPVNTCPVPAFDTTAIHARAIVDFALG